MEIKIGDIALIDGYVRTIRPGKESKLYPYKFGKSKRVLVLGKSKRFTGTVRYSGYEEPGILTISDAHDVWMVMPLASGDRYRKPIAVLAEQFVQD